MLLFIYIFYNNKMSVILYDIITKSKSSISNVLTIWNPKILILKFLITNKNLCFICKKYDDNIFNEILEMLIYTGIDVNAKDNNGLTALMHAARNGYENCIEKLCQMQNIDINANDNDELTALM